MRWMRVSVLPVAIAGSAILIAAPSPEGMRKSARPEPGLSEQGLREAGPREPEPREVVLRKMALREEAFRGHAPESPVQPAHINAASVAWHVSEAGERRSNRIIGGESIPDEDLHVGLWELAPWAIYAGHVHPVPEFYVLIEGQVEWSLGDETFLAEPGEFIYIAPSTMHRMVNLTDGVARAVWGRWAPNGDRSVYEGKSRYVEPIPEQPPEAVLFPQPGQ